MAVFSCDSVESLQNACCSAWSAREEATRYQRAACLQDCRFALKQAPCRTNISANLRDRIRRYLPAERASLAAVVWAHRRVPRNITRPSNEPFRVRRGWIVVENNVAIFHAVAPVSWGPSLVVSDADCYRPSASLML